MFTKKQISSQCQIWWFKMKLSSPYTKKKLLLQFYGTFEKINVKFVARGGVYFPSFLTFF